MNSCHSIIYLTYWLVTSGRHTSWLQDTSNTSRAGITFSSSSGSSRSRFPDRSILTILVDQLTNHALWREHRFLSFQFAENMGTDGSVSKGREVDFFVNVSFVNLGKTKKVLLRKYMPKNSYSSVSSSSSSFLFNVHIFPSTMGNDAQ